MVAGGAILGSQGACLWSAKSGTPEGDRLDVLAEMIDAYEVRSYPMDPPGAIDAIQASNPLPSSPGLSR